MPSSRNPILPLLLVTLVVSSCRRDPSETWGFVATLGSDTTSVERVTRTGDRIVGDAVGRSPVVVRRRWEATLAPDGSLRRWVMDTHVPNAPPGERDLHHEIERSGGAIRMVRQTGRDTMDRRVREPSVRTVPWNAFVYATSELLFQSARGLPESTRVGQYFFEGWSEGKLGFASVRNLGDGRVAVTSTGLAGSGLARLDAEGRMLSYSGEGTTYRQEVQRVGDVPDLDALFDRLAADERSRGVPRALSTRDTARAAIGHASLTIDYSRPLRRGRTLLGALIPYDRVWRTGANAATHLSTTAPIRIAGVQLDSGSYTLWTLPTRGEVRLVINRETGQWGTGYQPRHDIARVAMQADSVDAPVEQFTIRVDPTTSRLVMEWGTFRWSVPVEAPPHETGAPTAPRATPTPRLH